jgi:hypothetical protein
VLPPPISATRTSGERPSSRTGAMEVGLQDLPVARGNQKKRRGTKENGVDLRVAPLLL